MKRFYNILFFLFNLSVFGQNEFSWVPPLDIPIQLSGTFGELRNNHFHAGIDIRTQGRQGLKVRSVQDGRISRIRVSVSGYGKALYVEHRNGTTSVYAHLKKFAPKIEDYVKEKQYQKETFQIQLFLKKDELSIEAGEIIGFSGNTGGSYGPHLHFEMRETKGQFPINAMRYLMVIEDTQRPQVQNFYLYSGTQPNSNKKEFPLVKKNDSTYVTTGVIPSGRVNVGLRLFDRQNLSYNKNGIYSTSVRLNGIEQFKYTMDRISFNDSKYINLMIDYEVFSKNKRRIQRFVSHSKQKFSFLNETSPQGEMLIEPGKSYQILIELNDYKQNTTYVEAYLTGTNEVTPSKKGLGNSLNPTQDYFFEFDDKSVYFPEESFFDQVNMLVEDRGDTLHISQNWAPLQKPFEIKYKVPAGDSLTLAQSFLAIINKKGKPSFFTASKKEGFWEAKSKALGDYVVSRDSIAPEIKAVNFKNKQWLSNYSFLRLKITDDYSGIKKYRGTINGKWILLEHEPKNNSLIYKFNDVKFKEALHQLTIEAEDQVGNKTVFKRDFYRKPK